MVTYHVHSWKGRLEIEEIPSWSIDSVSKCWQCESTSQVFQKTVALLLQGEPAGCFLCQDCKDKLFW